MKNALIAVLFLGFVVVGYFAAVSNLRLRLEGVEGKTESVIRGDLTVPINATGEVRPHRRVEIKSEASGEVIQIARYPGDRVAAGELIIRLQRDDEERNVNRARLDLAVAGARLEEARIRLKQGETADLDRARAQVGQLEEQVRLSKYRLEKLMGLEKHLRNEEEEVQRDTAYRSAEAQLAAARSDLATAELAIPRLKQAVVQAEATFETAETNLADAEKRLSKTDIVAPVEGVVADIRTQIGEVIQGGKTTLTGGTVLAVLLDMSKLVVRAEVDEADIGRVLVIAPPWARPGHESDVPVPTDLVAASRDDKHPPAISVESFRDESFKGIIERVYPESRSISGVVTYLVEVVITSDNRKLLLPGMRADVRFTSDFVNNALLVPNEAIREGPNGELGVHIPKPGAGPDDRDTVFVSCKFGLDNGNYSEVKEGLDEGALVYTRLPRKQEREKERRGS